MGMDGILKPISPYLLDKIKNCPDFIDRYIDASYLSESAYEQEVTEWEIIEQREPEEINRINLGIILEGRTGECNIHKAWHGIHFLLTGDSTSTVSGLPFVVSEELGSDGLPLVNAVLGGTKTGCECGVDIVRYFSTSEVKQIAKALSKFSKKSLRERFNQGAITKPSLIYIKWEDKDMFERIYSFYKELVKYYKDTAKEQNCMLLNIS